MSPKTKTELANILVWPTVIGAIFVCSLILYILLESDPDVNIKYVHPKALILPVYSEKDIRVSNEATEFNKSSTDPYYVYIEFCIDKYFERGMYSNTLRTSEGYFVSLNVQHIPIVPGCHKYSIPFKIPSTIPPGSHTLSTTLYGRTNLVRGFSVPLYDITIDLK